MEVRAENIKPYDNRRGKTEQVRQMFDSIAPAYDFMNRMMTFGVDRLWRRRAVRTVAEAGAKIIVDIATGTGDLAIAMARAIPGSKITGLDLSEGMIELGRSKVTEAGLDDRVTLARADCLDMPHRV